MKLKQSEHDIQTAILNYLTNKRVKAIRINSGMLAVGEGKYRRMIRMAPVGTPDIIGCHNGLFIGIECKVPGNKPTEAQLQCMREWQEAGAICFVARSVSDVEQVLFKKHPVKEFELV